MKRSISLEWSSPAFTRPTSDNDLEASTEAVAPFNPAFVTNANLAGSTVSVDLEAQQRDTLALLHVEQHQSPEQDENSIAARTALQYVFVFWISATPATCMLIFLWVLRSVWAAALSFHFVACLLLPYAYIRCCFSHEHALALLRTLLHDLKRQVLFGCAYWVVFAGLGSAFYWMMGRLIVPNQNAIVEDLGLGDDGSVVAFGLYFCIANPAIEELFWRGFLVSALGGSERSLWTISALYASYHVVVLYTLQFELILVGMCFVLLVAAGRVFSLLAGVSGVASSALAHCAADMVIISVLCDWRWLQAQ